MTKVGVRVIIVDDDRELRESLQAVLTAGGFEVSTAQSGLRLISQLQVDRPQVILLDVMMSWIDGFELCRALKRNAEFAAIPVCFISGRGDPADVSEGLRAGAAAYFVKPIDTAKLMRTMTELARG